MALKTVRISDLSGEVITQDDSLVRMVVQEHPELGDSPVEIEVHTSEAAAIEQSELQVALVDLYYPGDDAPRRVAVEAAAFDKLATVRPMAEVLVAGRPARRAARSGGGGASRNERRDYATPEHAGEPHRGKITEAEQRFVRDHFDEVNERLTGQGIRAISLGDPDHVERYGLQELSKARQA